MRNWKNWILGLLLATSLISLSCLPIPDFRLVDNQLVTDCYGNLVPCTDLTYDLGNPTNSWHNAYIDTLIFTGVEYFYPETLTIVRGTYVSGTLDSLRIISDDDVYSIKDEAIGDGLTVQFIFNNVDRFDKVMCSTRYSAVDTDGIDIRLFNPTTGLWEDYNIITSGFKIYDFFSPTIPISAKYISPTGQVIAEIHHWGIGVVTHGLDIDLFVLKRN